jgi:hypothetical protein
MEPIAIPSRSRWSGSLVDLHLDMGGVLVFFELVELAFRRGGVGVDLNLGPA